MWVLSEGPLHYGKVVMGSRTFKFTVIRNTNVRNFGIVPKENNSRSQILQPPLQSHWNRIYVYLVFFSFWQIWTDLHWFEDWIYISARWDPPSSRPNKGVNVRISCISRWDFSSHCRLISILHFSHQNFKKMSGLVKDMGPANTMKLKISLVYCSISIYRYCCKRLTKWKVLTIYFQALPGKFVGGRFGSYLEPWI